MKGPNDLRHYDEWTEADGDVLWWMAPLFEWRIPYFGRPDESNFDERFWRWWSKSIRPSAVPRERLVWLPCPKPNTDGRELMKEKS